MDADIETPAEQPRFPIFTNAEEEKTSLDALQAGLLKLVAWQGMEKVHQNKADEYRRLAGLEEQDAAVGRTRAIEDIEAAVGRIKGDVPHMKLSADQIVCALPGDHLLVMQWEKGVLVQHVYGPADEDEQRVCPACQGRLRWPKTFVASQGENPPA